VGDAVFSLVIRTIVAARGNVPPKKLHQRSSELVKAETQSEMAFLLEEELTEAEADIYKRGRNAQSSTRAKNASLMDYRRATGVEALIGYLYLTDQFERMLYLIKKALDLLDNKNS
jgi:ribonuclease-3 family protein